MQGLLENRMEGLLKARPAAKPPSPLLRAVRKDEQGKAWNLDETIQRMRYRNGYDKPLTWMKSGEVYKVTFQPLRTGAAPVVGLGLSVAVIRSTG